jgi:hypothetical protein
MQNVKGVWDFGTLELSSLTFRSTSISGYGASRVMAQQVEKIEYTPMDRSESTVPALPATKDDGWVMLTSLINEMNEIA